MSFIQILRDICFYHFLKYDIISKIAYKVGMLNWFPIKKLFILPVIKLGWHSLCEQKIQTVYPG